ncbi:type II toxin-antitoxin system RelE/ParE family toxin [Phormidium pseudopriestleyi FRX01]|uniref:Type II toxin-antitoxin system RelE/ParE family toxin n=1 Tax=Phormidium pseudopriestleyi FRX01 TaxID=1759528 RepID=A0ABS3FRQ3_9CYAN|nr:type II toxin-antitoxin system RelE/ParE family toxin [Phormidium pseudopriestleyi]MBO0349062.1 type II toxin-antitoxin system RelE/ParE family toxin [Phormidium pseudopriestleyi FRX01]
MKYEFHPTALQEYAEAVQFFTQYDKHQDFIDTIENSIFRIVSAPDRWPIISIFYRVYLDRIVIAAIISCRRDPNYWKGRLES